MRDRRCRLTVRSSGSVLVNDLPKQGLRAGDLGAVVDRGRLNALEVEFVTASDVRAIAAIMPIRLPVRWDGVVTMTLDLDESVARAMEADVRLLPLLPELLTDLWELGPSAEDVVAALESVGLEPDSTVLDLACGKGAVAVALAEQLGVRVEAIDAFQPFLQAARALSTERGVSHACRFEQGDIRNLLGREEQYDVALLLSVGPVLGDYEQTIAGVRSLVRAGGYIVIEDGFLADGVAQLSWTEGYASHSETLRQLMACGDVVAREVICSTEQARSANHRNTDLIRQRARLLRASHPAFEQVIDEYVERQERETQLLGTDVVCAIWVLRRT